MTMYDDSGELVPSNRPMEESIIADRFAHEDRLVFYLQAAGLFESGINETVREDGTRIIEIGLTSPIRMGFSGEGSKAES